MKTDGGRSSAQWQRKTKFAQNKSELWLDRREEEEDLQLNEMMKNLSESSRTKRVLLCFTSCAHEAVCISWGNRSEEAQTQKDVVHLQDVPAAKQKTSGVTSECSCRLSL